MSEFGIDEDIGTKIVILLGAPGAGKGTVAQYLLDNYPIKHFSTGNLLRDEVKRGTSIGKRVEEILSSGKLVGDDIVNEVVELNLLRNLRGKEVLLFDGYPRTVEQAKFLDSIDSGKLVDAIKVLEIDIDQETAVSRIAGRVVCSKCSATFAAAQFASGSNVCPKCGGELTKRADDSEEVVRRRLQEYVNMTLPVSNYYGARLSKVSGMGSPKEVARDVDIVFRTFGIEERR